MDLAYADRLLFFVLCFMFYVLCFFFFCFLFFFFLGQSLNLAQFGFCSTSKINLDIRPFWIYTTICFFKTFSYLPCVCVLKYLLFLKKKKKIGYQKLKPKLRPTKLLEQLHQLMKNCAKWKKVLIVHDMNKKKLPHQPMQICV